MCKVTYGHLRAMDGTNKPAPVAARPKADGGPKISSGFRDHSKYAKARRDIFNLKVIAVLGVLHRYFLA